MAQPNTPSSSPIDAHTLGPNDEKTASGTEKINSGEERMLSMYGITVDRKNGKLLMPGFSQLVNDERGNEVNAPIDEIVFEPGESLVYVYGQGSGSATLTFDKPGSSRSVTVSNTPFREQFFEEQAAKAGLTPEMLKTISEFGIPMVMVHDLNNRSIMLETMNFTSLHHGANTVSSHYIFNARDPVASLQLIDNGTVLEIQAADGELIQLGRRTRSVR